MTRANLTELEKDAGLDVADLASRAFEDARARLDSVARDYLVAGRRIRVVVCGTELSRVLTPALAHLETPVAGDADLEIGALDSAEAGQSPPPLPSADAVVAGEPVPRALLRDGTVSAFGQPAEQILSVLDWNNHRAVFWAKDARELPSWEAAAPLRVILGWWLGARGIQLVHAAAVGTETGGVLVAGRGGSGKSTTSLLALRDGLLFAADDYVLISSSPPYVHSLFGSAKLEPRQLASFPELAGRVWQNGDARDKSVVLVNAGPAEGMAAGFPLVAVLVAAVTARQDTLISPISPARALRGLAPSTLLQLPGGGAQSLTIMTKILSEVPAFSIELGSPESVAPAIRELLDGPA